MEDATASGRGLLQRCMYLLEEPVLTLFALAFDEYQQCDIDAGASQKCVPRLGQALQGD